MNLIWRHIQSHCSSYQTDSTGHLFLSADTMNAFVPITLLMYSFPGWLDATVGIVAILSLSGHATKSDSRLDWIAIFSILSSYNIWFRQKHGIWDSWGGIATRLDDRGIGVRFPVGLGDISLLHSPQTGSGAHQMPYTMSTGACFSGGEVAGREAVYSPHIIPRWRIVGRCLRSPIRLHGVVLN
jgi:hypothetical protein